MLTQCLFFQFIQRSQLQYEENGKKDTAVAFINMSYRGIRLENPVKIFCSILQSRFPTRKEVIRCLCSDQLFNILLGIYHRDVQTERTALQQALLQYPGCIL